MGCQRCRRGGCCRGSSCRLRKRLYPKGLSCLGVRQESKRRCAMGRMLIRGRRGWGRFVLGRDSRLKQGAQLGNLRIISSLLSNEGGMELVGLGEFTTQCVECFWCQGVVLGRGLKMLVWIRKGCDNYGGTRARYSHWPCRGSGSLSPHSPRGESRRQALHPRHPRAVSRAHCAKPKSPGGQNCDPRRLP